MPVLPPASPAAWGGGGRLANLCSPVGRLPSKPEGLAGRGVRQAGRPPGPGTLLTQQSSGRFLGLWVGSLCASLLTFLPPARTWASTVQGSCTGALGFGCLMALRTRHFALAFALLLLVCPLVDSRRLRVQLLAVWSVTLRGKTSCTELFSEVFLGQNFRIS